MWRARPSSGCPRVWPGTRRTCSPAAVVGGAAHNVTRWTDLPRGGHFAAMEQPELFAADLWEFFATVR